MPLPNTIKLLNVHQGRSSHKRALCDAVHLHMHTGLHSEAAAGVLDGLLSHEGKDFASVAAILKMVPPLEAALQSYRDRAAAAKRSVADVVMLEAAVQGW